MRFRDPSGVQSLCDDLCIDGVIFSPMLRDTELPNARRVEHMGLVSPRLELVVDVPPFTARFEGHSCRWRRGAESTLELRQRLDRRAAHDLAIDHFAIRDVAHTEIQSYASHDEPPLGPQPSGNLCL